MIRQLRELKIRASEVLRLEESSFRSELTDVAVSSRSPSSAFFLAETIALNHGHTLAEAEEFAKSVRWLAIIRRDHGDKDLYRTIGIERNQAQG